MPKIYNEIVIDMNPESSTFEEVLHEDSYEYEGEMMLAQGETATSDERLRFKYQVNSGTSADPEWSEVKYKMDKDVSRNWIYKHLGHETVYQSLEWDDTTNSYKETGWTTRKDPLHHYGTTLEADQKRRAPTEWGAGSISKDDFIDPVTGKPRSVEAIKGILGPKLPGLDEKALDKQITEMAPKFTEDVYGMGKEKEFAKEAYEKDIYGLQAGARKIGGAMRSAYGGMGSGMRAGIGATGALSTQFEQAGQKLEKSMYDIEQVGEEKYEQDIAGWLNPDWFKPQGKEGGYVKRDRSGITNDLEETFLDVLTQLPDAGGS